jgi:hypothetical protein
MNESTYPTPSYTMTLPKPSRFYTLLNLLPCRIALVLLTILAASSLLPLLFLVNRLLSPVILRLFTILILGLLSGFTARLILARNTFLLKLLSAWLGVISGMIAMHAITTGFIGFRLLPFLAKDPNWSGLAQLLLSMLAAWLALYAWKPKHRSTSPAGQVKASNRDPVPLLKKQSPKPAISVNTRTHQRIHVKKPAFLSANYWRSQRKQVNKKLSRWQSQVSSSLTGSRQKASQMLDSARVRLNIHPGPANGKIRLRRPKNKPIARANMLRGRTIIRLVGKQENRCPYCLELVQKNDPRGINICPICHTYHHTDCWETGGGCQVPHIHE